MKTVHVTARHSRDLLAIFGAADVVGSLFAVFGRQHCARVVRIDAPGRRIIMRLPCFTGEGE